MGIGFRRFAALHRADFYDPYGEHDEDESEHDPEHEEHASEWDDIHSGMHEMHRGLGVHLSHEDHAIVHDPNRPLHERAHHLLNTISRGDQHGGVGTHWTTTENVAEDFATTGPIKHMANDAKRHAVEHGDHRYGTDVNGDPKGQPVTSVMLHAHPPERHAIDDNPDERAYGSGSIYGYHDHGEREVPIHPGSEVPIKGISFKQTHSFMDEPDDDPDFEHHEFGETQHHQAVRRTAMPGKHPSHPDMRFDTYDAPDWSEHHREGEETHPGWSHHLLRAHDPGFQSGFGAGNENMAGSIYYSRTPEGSERPGVAIHDMSTSPGARGRGVASAMQDELRRQHPDHMIDHGSRTPSGKGWASQYTDPGRPELDLHHPSNAGQEHHYRPTELAKQLAEKDLSYLGAMEPVSLKAPDFETPACTYCGSTQVSSQENNGRADRVVCDACGGTMVAAPGDQFMPDLIGSPHNHPAQNADPDSGGVGGAANHGVVHDVIQRSSGLDDIGHLSGQSHEQMAKHYEGKAGPLTPVKKAGFAGYVEPYDGFHEETKEVDRDAHGGAGDFNHSLYDRVRPDPTKSEMHSHENSEYGDMPSRYHERHYDAYEDALHEQQHDDAPVAHHRELGQFIGGSGMDDTIWNKHAQTEKVHPHAQPIYACQSHVVNEHVARYLRNPGDKTAFEHMKDERGEDLPAFAHAYAGTHMPMMVRHQGNLFTTEGHHRTAVALHTGHPLNVSVWDADKHGLPNEDDKHKPGWGHDPEGDPYSGLQHHGALIGAGACAFGHLTGRAARMHAFANHDDGVCSATALLHHNQGGAMAGDIISRRHARIEPELGFHLTATWAEVRDKATRIAREGGVHIAVASLDGIGGTVKGDHNLYETFLTYVPGSRKVGYWNCGCKWAAYAWGRSPAYRQFNGRMCSHALAMQFEALKQHAFERKQVEEHDFRPAWMRDKQVVVQHQRATDRAPAVDHRRDAARHVEAVADTEVYPEHHHLDLVRAPLYAVAVAGSLAAEDPGRLVTILGRFGASPEGSRALVRQALDDTFLERTRTAAHPIDEFRRDILMMDPADQHSGGGGGHQPGQPGNHDGGHQDDGGENGVPENPKGTDDDTPDDGSGEGEPKSHENNPLDPAHFTHRTEDARRHAPDFGWGVPMADGLGIHGCPQCTDAHGVSHGCGACGGSGQVDSQGGSLIPDQNVDAGPYSKSQGMGSGGIPTFGSRFAERALAHFDALMRGDRAEAERISRQADYSSYDWQGDASNRKPNPHSDSRNPASTGWATGQDPVSWDGAATTPSSRGFDSITSAKAPKLDMPTHAGVALMAADTGRGVFLQRSMSDEKDPARGRWEFPGGGLEPGDHSTLHGGIREWEEEVGQPFPQGGVVHHTWRSGPYQGHVVVIPKESQVDPRAERQVHNPDDDNEVVAWLHPKDMKGRPDLRDEVRSGTPWKHLEQAGPSLRAAAGWSNPFAAAPQSTDEPAGGTPSPWESHKPVQGAPQGAESCAACGAPSVAYDAHKGHGWCRAHIDEKQSGPNPIAEEFPERAGKEPLATRLMPIAIAMEHPEPALPFTEGEDNDEATTGESPGERYRSQMSPEIGSTQTSSTPNSATYASLGGTTDEIVARFQATAGAAALNAPSAAQAQQAAEGGYGGDPGGGDIASAAREHLARTAMKDFRPDEQRALIEEGRGGPRARNFGDLKIEGTHYADIPDDEMEFL